MAFRALFRVEINDPSDPLVFAAEAEQYKWPLVDSGWLSLFHDYDHIDGWWACQEKSACQMINLMNRLR